MHQVSAKFVPRFLTDDPQISSKEQTMKKIFWKISLLVTRHGFTVMTLKPNNNPQIKRVLLRLTPRQHDTSACEWKQCCLFLFLTIETLCYMNLQVLLKVSKLIMIFTWRFWDVCGIQYEKSHLKCGLQEAATSITIMSLLTQCCQLDNSSQNFQLLPFHKPPIHLTSPLSTFSYFLNSKLPLKEDFRQQKTSSLMQWMTWRWYHKHPSNIASKKWKRCIAVILKGIIFNNF